MPTLARHISETFRISNDIGVTVLDTEGNPVRSDINVPKELHVVGDASLTGTLRPPSISQ
jgi:sRNA-binding carbon storage regulator CsrA